MMHIRVASKASFRLQAAANAGRRSTLLPRRYKSAPTADKVIGQEARATVNTTPTPTVKSTSPIATSLSAKTSPVTTANSVPIVKSLVAAFLGVGTVSAIAALVERSTADSCLPFDPKGQRFDQSQLTGRFARMLLACDPSLLFYTNAQVLEAQKFLTDNQDFNTGADRALWEAKRIVDAAIHPDTHEFIPRPFRMSGYVPYNGPICVAMIASQTTPTLLFWSWVNQSQNALVNYFNRNAASPMPNETLIKSYAAAVGSALAVAFGLATLIQKRFDPLRAKRLMKWVSFPSAVVASSLNCYIVRSPELTTGVPLQDAAGQNVLPGETSKVAAKRGVESTTLSRAILQAPVYLLPPIVLASGPVCRYLTRNPVWAVPLTTYMLLVSFGVGLPFTVALFPQIAAINAADVEEKFQQLRHPITQQPHSVFYYNKGL